MDNCTLKKDIARRNFKKLATATITDSRRRVVDILDFKKQHDQTLYLVQRDGDLEGSWETEASIEAQDMLSDYQKKVHDESGYSFQGESQGRLSRLSKARAVMAIKNTESALLFSNDENDSNDNFKSGTKRKVSSSNNRSHAKKGKSVGGRKTKAIITLETQKEERQARKVQREVLNVGLIMQEIEENDNSDCCLVCAAGSYKKCLKKDDIKGFKRALNDVDNVPAPSDNNSYDLGILGLSIVLGKMNFIKLIDEKKRELELKPTKRPEIPAKYMKQDFGTGSNYARGAYGGISFRQVQVSRGNRQGDSAFYDNLNTQSEDYKIQVDLDTQLSCENIQGFMSYISKPSFEELETIYSYKQHVNSSPIDVYYAAVAGNRKLVSHLIQTDFQGRSPFNSLHVETLAFIDGRPLGNYRKPQILKNAFEARGITPFHCAAINPSRIYLQEFYEVLDSSERLKVDNCGRTVIFFAAASETSDCLEYLISQGVSVTQMDKYRVTPLVQATRFGRLHNVDLIIKKLLEGKKDNEDSSIVFQSLIRNKRTVLHLAAFFGHIEICRILIRYGCPVEAVEALEKQTALMYAAKNGQFECVRILIEEGNANPEKGDKYAKNALHLACIGGHLEIVKYLLSQGLDANASDSSQNRPAHYAAAFGHLDILRLLIHYGQANPGLSSVWRTTPCSIANVKGHMAVVKYLLSLPGNLINVDFKNEEGRTMLQHTVTESASNVQDQELNLKKARLLISMNANVNVTDLNGDTCLHLIAKSTTFIGCLPRFYESFYPEKRRKERRCEYQSEKLSRTFDDDDQDGIVYYETFAKLLISHGADIHLKNQEGETPLASAMRSNNHSIVILLIQSGAKYWEDVDREGNNFIHYFTRFIAYVDQLQPHRDIDQVQKDRFLAYADAVFNSIETEQPVNDGLKLLANTANNEGYPPIVYGVYQAIRLQKKAVAREKSMIRDVLGYPYQYSTEYKQKYNLEAEEARNYEIDLTLSFNLWASIS
ncbi:hypothetical protein G6F56_000547 [Rhizopus delemar]|nr:hypothetical protein G6F56_000547 [Rhizopus delemar]